jgi:gliding motility-associated-like protein
MGLVRRAWFIALIFSGITSRLAASHLMGGEITWKCQGSGAYIFQMKLYRDCNGVQGPGVVSLDVFNNPALLSIPLNLVTQVDISPQCNAIGPNITCANAMAQPNWPNSVTPVTGAVEEFVYQSAPVTLTGTPPAAGWIFAYSSCCRNTAITNVNNASGGIGFTLRAIMYSYNALPGNPCYDSSPEFLESPKTIICTGYPFTYNHNAVDADLDSLSYAWAQPLDSYTSFPPNPFTPANIPFVSGFAYNNPMPGPALNPGNVPATINAQTGEISYTSYTSGNFVTCIEVSAWRCGQVVAKIYRDIQVVLLACGNNTPPAVTPPFNSNTTFTDTVYAGQLVSFTLSATDFDFLSNGNPQTLTINATGQEFGAGFTNAASGCINPPCATLNPPPPVSGPFGVSTDFNWQTACNHVLYTNQCFVQSNTYNFVIRTTDDFCPAPAQTIATISITVLTLPVVESPDVHCVAVQPNGDVTLTWEQPLDTDGTFNSYHVFSSVNPNGPFTVVDSIFNYNQLTYTHVGANAGSGPVYYYVQTRSGCGGMIMLPAQDTVSSMYLQVTNSNNTAALLNWNNISAPPPQSQFGWFRIYREYPVGTWTLIDSTQALNYVDSIQICSSQINYRIEIGDSLGCVSVSNIDGDLFIDNVIPAIPVLDSTSVATNGTMEMGWVPSTSPDVIGYVIYQYINGIWTAIDTVWGLNSTGYVNSISNSTQQSELYAIASLDSCGNISTFGPVHNTIFLSRSLDVCTGSTTLWWNAYDNMPGGLGGYNIYASENAGPWTLIGTNTANDSDFVHTGLTQFSTYCYFIRAFSANNTITASSEQVCVFANVPQQPVFNYLRVATVAGTNSVEIRAYVDVNASLARFDVYRADSITGSWMLLGNVPFNPASSLVIYTDNTAETGVQSYYYKMIAVDSCGDDAFTSNIGRTIYLEAFSNNEITNTLFWNDYEAWLGGVTQYDIYRCIDGVCDPAPIASVPYTGAGENTFTDDVSPYYLYVGKFSYRVEGVEGPGNTYNFTDTTSSNVAEVVQRPLVFVPNAFTPNGNGVNDIFLPSVGFVDIVDYHFAVYNRWGEKLFETDDRYLGWDGRYSGHKCDSEVYVWILTFKTASGEYIDQKGIVTLLR